MTKCFQTRIARLIPAAGLFLSLTAIVHPQELVRPQERRQVTFPAQAGDEARVAIGKKIYREGVLPSGQPVSALVQGDVPVEGTQFTCLSCHQRSGWGATEGQYIVLPSTAPALYQARETGYRTRPAYTDQRLAMALRDGVDPSGRAFDPLMPLYLLADEDMAALIAYLKTLSAEPSPGVEDLTIHFATVVTEEVEPSLQKAMLDVLETFFREKNGLTRNEIRRLESGPWIRDYKYKAHREWILHPWFLKGSAETWPAQLEAYYREQPVFALLSGISTLDWRPIHEFSEKHKIPSLLPNTHRPIISEDDYYTLYFSKGLTLEAQVIAAHLSRQSSPQKILQVFLNEGASAVAAHAFRAACDERESVSVLDMPLAPGKKLTASQLAGWRKETGATAVVLWLSWESLAGVESPSWTAEGSSTVYLSSMLLGVETSVALEVVRNGSFLVHPYTLTEERRSRFARVGGWLRSRKIQQHHDRVQAQTYFACMMMGEGLMHIKRYFYRDYLMDSLDHADRMAVYSAFYPRLSFGPGQRYLAKGSYVVKLEGDEKEPLSERSIWVVP